MKSLLSLPLLAAALMAATPGAAQIAPPYPTDAQAQDEEARFAAAQRRFDSEYRTFQAAVDRYKRFQSDRAEALRESRYLAEQEAEWDAARYYRPGNYQERVLGPDDRVYRGDDGRYYCRRSDGTTGLIVGAAAGGLFGNVISSRRSSTVGTLLGAIAGGALGSSIDRNNQQIRCR